MTPVTARSATLASLTEALRRFGAESEGNSDTRLSGVSQDSRRIEPGMLFAVRSGERADGARFVPQALERGASALLVERRAELDAHGVPVLRVDEVRSALAEAAEFLYGYPSRELALVGITGTNGKTTTASLLRQCIEHLSGPCAELGTLGFRSPGGVVQSGFTTPEADVISSLLRSAVNEGARYCTMEVSSHALSGRRVDALRFEVAAFSNLTQDHLDFHGSLSAYGAAKARLFLECQPHRSVLNIDDAFGAELQQRLPVALTVGQSEQANVRLLEEAPEPEGQRLRVSTDVGTIAFSTRLVGRHNVDNWLLTIGVLRALDLDVRRIAEFSLDITAAAGRFERCDTTLDDVRVLIDYAHTPDALERVLGAARPLTSGRLICVFGCGGDRDAGKRPRMGKVAAAGADRVVLTNDNPRSEDPNRIVQAIEEGVRSATTDAARWGVCLDRAEAIRSAILEAEPGDLILIAGKGHEDYQILGSRTVPFDDRTEARAALRARREQSS